MSVPTLLIETLLMSFLVPKRSDPVLRVLRARGLEFAYVSSRLLAQPGVMLLRGWHRGPYPKPLTLNPKYRKATSPPSECMPGNPGWSDSGDRRRCARSPHLRKKGSCLRKFLGRLAGDLLPVQSIHSVGSPVQNDFSRAVQPRMQKEKTRRGV